MLVLVTLMSISVYAESAQQNVQTNLQFTCTVNYQVPSNSATYNISIFYPNGTTLVSNALTSSQGQGAFNYTTTFPTLGIYKINSFCYDGSNGNYSSSDYITISNSGDELTTGKSIIFIVFMIAILVTMGLTLWGCLRLPYSNHQDESGSVFSINNLKYVKLFLGVMFYVELILFFGLTRGILNNYVSATGIAGFFDVGYWIFLNGLWVAIPCIFVWAIMLLFKDAEINKVLDRGFNYEK
jgi:hypothetical protein